MLLHEGRNLQLEKQARARAHTIWHQSFCHIGWSTQTTEPLWLVALHALSYAMTEQVFFVLFFFSPLLLPPRLEVFLSSEGPPSSALSGVFIPSITQSNYQCNYCCFSRAFGASSLLLDLKCPCFLVLAEMLIIQESKLFFFLKKWT